MKSVILSILFTSAVLAQQPNDTARKATSRHKAPKPAIASADISSTITRPAIEVHREIPLPPAAKTALDLSMSSQENALAPTVDSTGRVLWTYGKGTPVVVCSLLEVCELDLEPGEVINKDSVDRGDPRYEFAQRTAGTGPGQFPYLIFKPTEPGLNTSMIIGTNKRVYYIRMISTANGQYMTRVAFCYPEDQRKMEQAAQLAEAAISAQTKAAQEKLQALTVERPLRNWNYEVKLHGRDAAYLRPYSIKDDGIKTHIWMSDEARHRGLPVIQISDARGPIPVNTRWEGNELVVDAVFEHGCLLEGVGHKQQRACITNKGLGK